jgi:hypothetical protein
VSDTSGFGCRRLAVVASVDAHDRLLASDVELSTFAGAGAVQNAITVTEVPCPIRHLVALDRIFQVCALRAGVSAIVNSIGDLPWS